MASSAVMRPPIMGKSTEGQLDGIQSSPQWCVRHPKYACTHIARADAASGVSWIRLHKTMAGQYPGRRRRVKNTLHFRTLRCFSSLIFQLCLELFSQIMRLTNYMLNLMHSHYAIRMLSVCTSVEYFAALPLNPCSREVLALFCVLICGV